MFAHRSVSLTAILGAMLGVGTSAGAQTLDFQHLEQNNNQVNNVGNVVTEDGFEVTKAPGEPFEFAVFGTQESRYPGSTALFNNTVNGLIKITKVGGGTFDVASIDFAMLNGTGSVTINLTGRRPDNSTVQQQIVHTDNSLPLNLVTYTLNGFTGLASIEWLQQSPFHQFDNVVIGGGGYSLSISGQCPGQITVNWSGATPNRQQGIVFGQSQGNTTIPGGVCQGTVLGIQGGVQLVRTIGTGSGSGSTSGNAGTAACRRFLQLVEAPSCNTSNVAQIP